MFSIFRRPSVIHLDCFTPYEDVVKLFPISDASSYLPKWFKDIPPKVKYQGPDRGTMRSCPGVNDLFKKGFIIPSWKDFYFEVQNGIANVVPQEDGENHHPSQWGKGLADYSHVKLLAPWLIKEKTGVDFIFSNAYWYKNMHQAFVPNGIVNYKYQSSANINMLVHKNIFPKEFTIDAGEPIAHCIPLSDKNIKLHLHAVSRDEFEKLQPYGYGFANQYYRSKKILEGKK